MSHHEVDQGTTIGDGDRPPGLADLFGLRQKADGIDQQRRGKPIGPLRVSDIAGGKQTIDQMKPRRLGIRRNAVFRQCPIHPHIAPGFVAFGMTMRVIGEMRIQTQHHFRHHLQHPRRRVVLPGRRRQHGQEIPRERAFMRQQIPQAQLQIQRIDRIRRGLAQATVHEQGPPVRRHFGLAQLDQALTAGALAR